MKIVQICAQRAALAILLVGYATLQALAADVALTAQDINAAAPGTADRRAVTAKLQVLLDRASVSPGVIDGHMGENVVNALTAFVSKNDISGASAAPVGETPDVMLLAAWAMFGTQASQAAFIDYQISADDVKGPFTKSIPKDFEEKKTLPRLGYASALELLGEKFHMDVDLLKELNPGVAFDQAGTRIVVANVSRKAPDQSVTRIEVDKARKQVRAYSDQGSLIAIYPATIGSASRPAPVGSYEVKGVARNPTYTYNPDYKFQGVKATKPFVIAPGPNNPVGSVWIDLSKDGYGIHGTPEPSEIGKTASHGCVRLTNWDALSLAKMVKPGVPVDFLN